MKLRKLGSTGISVSEIGFGAWGIGGWEPGQLSYGPVDENTALDALHAAIEKGITFFDTSPLYGEGNSEILVGRAVKQQRERVVIATKAGYSKFSSPQDFSPNAINQSVEGSLRRLQTDYIDLLQLHDPTIEILGPNGRIRDVLENLVEEGKIRTYGVSLKNPIDALTVIKEFEFPVVQVNFNMLDLRALECGLLDQAAKMGSGLIARTPLCFGFLTGEFSNNHTFPENDHRSRWDRDQINRWVQGANAVQEACKETGEINNIIAALRFCLSFQEVSTVIPGIMNRSQAELNATASDKQSFTQDLIDQIREINRNSDFYSQ